MKKKYKNKGNVVKLPWGNDAWDLNKIYKILPDKREEKAFQAEGTIGKV